MDNVTAGITVVSPISAFLALAAILSSLLAIGFFILWLRGTTLIVLPGLGLIVATSFVALLLLIVAVVALLLAMLS